MKLTWSEADNGGSAITSYNIYRSATSNAETLLATVNGSTLNFNDVTASDPAKIYYYKVEAVNAQGASCRENEVSVRYLGDSHAGTGYVIADDPVGVTDGAPQAASPDLDIQTLSILEPSSGPNAGKIVFNLKVVSLATIPDQRMWRIIWGDPRSPGQQFYVGMTKNGAVTYEYGTVATATVGLVLGVPSTTAVGVPDSGTFDPGGLITIAVSKDKIGGVNVGDILGAFAVRTYNIVTDQVRGTNAIDTNANANANDTTANAASYAVVGSIPQLVSAVSRKQHGAGGPVFDVPLPLTGPIGIECRTGAVTGSHQVVFTFATNIVAVSGATVTPGAGGTASISGAPVIAGNEVSVNLVNASNAQTLAVTLVSVNDGTNIGDVSAPMSILLGDVNASGRTDSGDQTIVRNSSVTIPNNATFRSDVTTSNRIDSGDQTVVRNNSVTILPSNSVPRVPDSRLER